MRDAVCTVVIVDTTAKFSGGKHSLGAYLVCLVGWNIQLEEAGVSLREGRLVHVLHESDFMLIAKISRIDRQSGATPDEFEIQASLFGCHCLENSPEAYNDLVIVAAVWVACD